MNTARNLVIQVLKDELEERRMRPSGGERIEEPYTALEHFFGRSIAIALLGNIFDIRALCDAADAAERGRGF